ncbi:hypothetical protein [Chitinibacter sp. ZOR0017]|uniref:hypothetical protein n=1 Tax=Chitinibacter sp. ZOR0017 TaxID=1339254 RepID=UPI000646F652|nr:hypothetical protein [Chitinibacter sp. ZOR0017]
MKIYPSMVSSLLVALLANPFLLAQAQARDFSYLAGRDNRKVADQLAQAGYSQVHTEISGDDKWDTWWNASTQDCITAYQTGYTYQSLRNTPRADCEKYADGGGSKSNAVALGLGVAAAVGVAALINHQRHKHQHDDVDERQHRYFVDVEDLQGIRASYGESELQSRGFHNVDGEKGWHRSYTTWWNSAARECVQVTTRQGRYSDINVVDNSACL